MLVVFNVFLCLARILKFFDAQGRLSVINGTFSNAAIDLAHFILMLGSVMLCFSFVGYLTFGSKVASYSTMGKAFNMVYKIALGDFDFDELYESGADQSLAVLYFYLVTLLVLFIMTNVFLAIVMDAYAAANELAKQEETLFAELYQGATYFFFLWQGRVRGQMMVIPDHMAYKVMDDAKEYEHLTFKNMQSRFRSHLKARNSNHEEVPIELLWDFMEKYGTNPDGPAADESSPLSVQIRKMGERQDQMLQTLEQVLDRLGSGVGAQATV